MEFYEQFWADSDYQLSYAFDSAVRDRYPSIEQLWGTMPRPKRVLDYGCGNGVLTFWMHSHGFGEEVLGLDVSHTAVRDAQQRFGKPGLQFRVLEDQPLSSLGTFDVVVCSHVLEHLSEPGKTLETLRRLAPWLLLEVPLENNFVQNTLEQLGKKNNTVGHVQFWTLDGFRGFLRSHRLLPVQERHYASAPFSPFSAPVKRAAERLALRMMGVGNYGRLMSTHYAALIWTGTASVSSS